MQKQRQGVLVKPYERLTQKQIEKVDETSRSILEDQGLICYNKNAARKYSEAGAQVTEEKDFARVRIGAGLVDKALETAPSKIVLGARNPDNKLILDAREPRVRFGSGSETNVWLDVQFEGNNPVFNRLDGSIERLRAAAHLCDNLKNLDFFIRCVNIQDKDVTP
jgi:trimethylamine--corrinoid protein Co-methyltransferase